MNSKLSLTHSTALTNEPNHWCCALSDRYRFTLSADLVDWFAREIWLRDQGGEFDQPVSPSELLCETPDFIWPGFMLPDSLPLVGNRYGDWLCLRVGADNSVAEVIHWYHGGGDWMKLSRLIASAAACPGVVNITPTALPTSLNNPVRRRSPAGLQTIFPRRSANCYWTNRAIPMRSPASAN